MTKMKGHIGNIEDSLAASKNKGNAVPPASIYASDIEGIGSRKVGAVMDVSNKMLEKWLV